MSRYYENRQSTYQNDDMDDQQSYGEEGMMREHSMGHGSLYGHGHPAVPATPKSWVQYPDFPGQTAESQMSHAPSNGPSLRGPRPPPEPFLRRQIYRPDPNDNDMDDEVEEDDYIENTEPIMHSVYQTEYGMGPERRYHAPQPASSPTPMPVSPLYPQRTKFVGGFFKGLKKVFRGKPKDKPLRRKGTFGTDGTSTTNITTNDTLPRYLSNPSIGPSNPQFARRLTMAVNSGNLPPETTPMTFESLSPPHHYDSSRPLPFHLQDVNNPPLQSVNQPPMLLVTPASDTFIEGERAEVENMDSYDTPPPPQGEHPQQHSYDEADDDEEEERSRQDMGEGRATMMMYNNTDPSHPSQHGHASQGHAASSSHPTTHSHPYSNAPSQSHHHSVAPSQSHHYSNAPSYNQPYSNAPSVVHQPYSNSPSQAQPYSNAPSQHYSHSPSHYPQYSTGPSTTGVSRMPSVGRRVSYPSELPTRATMEAMQGRQVPPPVPPLPETSMSMGVSMGPTSPQRRTTFFSSRRPTTAGTSVLSPRSGKSGTSMTRSTTRTTTTGTTISGEYTVSTAATSCYDPSFASDLNPVEKFFKGLYNLPWIAPERVTVDYRPADSPRAKAKVKIGAKKPAPSWYRSLVTRSKIGTIDAVDNLDVNVDGTMSVGGTTSPRTSRRRSREHRSHRHSSPTKATRRHRRHRRRTVTTMTTDTGLSATTADGHRREAASPPIHQAQAQAAYPYPYPPYAYPYPYPAYPAMSPPPRESGSRSASPRGARKHKSGGSREQKQKYAMAAAAGYQQASFQPMALPAGHSPGMAGPVYFVSPSPPGSNEGDGRHGHGHGHGVPVQVSPVMMHYIPTGFHPNHHTGMRSPVQT